MLHTLSEEAPEDYNEISFVCLRPDGCLELPSTLGIVCRSVSNRLDGFEGFHFHFYIIVTCRCVDDFTNQLFYIIY